MTDLTALQDRFLSSLASLIGGDDRAVCLAVSGGTDSMAMLLLAQATIPERVIAATVDHRLRAAAADEAAYVAQICGERNIPHTVLTVVEEIAGNIQSQAREKRYALLTEHADQHGAGRIATAHHRDDQIETFLMRLARGSGIEGLSSIRRTNGNIIRPLLDFTRAELEQVCLFHGIAPVQDPSNDDDSFDRVKMRKWLRENELPVDASAISMSIQALSESASALIWMAEQLSKERILEDGDAILLDADGLPAELQRRLFLLVLDRLQPGYAPRGTKLSNALQQLRQGEKAMLGDIQITGGSPWRFTKAPPRRH